MLEFVLCNYNSSNINNKKVFIINNMKYSVMEKCY